MITRKDPLDVIMNKKAILLSDKQRWLDIIELFYTEFQESKNQDTKRFLKEQMRLCGEQSQEIKRQLMSLK